MKRYSLRNTIDFVVIIALVMFGLFEFIYKTTEVHYGLEYALAVLWIVLLYILSATIEKFYSIVRNMVLPLLRFVSRSIGKPKEADLGKKEKTIEELKRLQGYISDVRLTIDRGFLDNKSRHGCRELLEKYEWLTGKVDVDNGVSLRVIDGRIDRIIAKMEIYSYQKALNELGVKEPRKEWDFGKGKGN